jgi:OHCU decarboxylase
MAARRPFADRDGLLAAADSVWFSLGREDWLEAFGHHPRIGERNIGRFGAGAATASKEQSGMASASEAERVEFAAGNEAYEKKFGHVFLIFASGKSAGEMLEQLRRRLGNDAGQEMANAAREQSLITRLRLERWLAS